MTSLISERQIYIKNYLCCFFPKVIAEVISKYDYEFKGTSYVLGNHEGWVSFLDILPDCNNWRIVSESLFASNVIKIWNLQTKRCDATFLGDTYSWNGASLPDGRIINVYNETLRIWNP